MLNDKQKWAYALASQGHNYMLSGQAGSGKTYTVKAIYHGLSKSGKKVAVTCTTGLACQQYREHIETMTIHR
jgi:DNA replication protein DnaC